MNVSDVNFDKLDEVNEYARTICETAGSSGMFTSAYPADKTFNDIRRSAKIWLQEIDSRLKELSPAEALEAITYYDIIHRIGYCSPAYPETINRHVLRAFDAYIHGDTSVDQYELFRAISLGLKRRDKAYFDRPLEWHSDSLDCWYRQFKHGACLEKLTEYDTTQRVTLLLESDLWAFTPDQAAFKHRLATAHRPLSLRSTSDTKILKVQEQFRTVSRKYLKED